MGKRFLFISVFILTSLFFNAQSAEIKSPSLWERFWVYDINQLKLTHMNAWRERLIEQATITGRPPASDAPVIRRNYAAGKIRVLFILAYRDTRYPFELAARFDNLEYDTLPVSLFSSEALAGDGFQKVRGFDRKEFEKKLLSSIEEGSFDVVVSSDFDGGAISPEGQMHIKKWIDEGLGWVDMGTTGADNPIHKLFPVYKRKLSVFTVHKAAENHFIGSGFPENAQVKAAIPEKTAGRKILSADTCIDWRGRPVKGEGIVIAVNELKGGRLVSYCAGWPGFTIAYAYPADSTAGKRVWYRSAGLWNEAEFSLLIKSILWAGKKETPVFVRVPSDSVLQQSEKQEGIPLLISLTEGRKEDMPLNLTAVWQIRDETGLQYDGGKVDFNISVQKPAGVLLKPSVRLLTGTSELFYDIIDGNGRLVSWGEDIINTEGKIQTSDISLQDFYKRTSTKFTGKIAVKNSWQEAKKISVSFKLFDSHNKRIPFAFQKQLVLNPAGITETEFEFQVNFNYLFGPMGFLHVELAEPAKNGTVIERKKIPFFAPESPSELLKDWQVGVCAGGPDIFWPAFARVFREYGFNAVFRGIWRYPDDLLSLASEGFSIYTEYIYTALGHFSRKFGENIWFWDKTTRQGSSGLVPHSSEEGRKTMERLTDRASALQKLGVVGYAASEEVGLGPQETCFSQTAQELFRRWALEKYGTISRLNDSWGTDYLEEAEIRGILLSDAIKESPNNPAHWIDFRMFMEDVFNGRIEDFSRYGKTVVEDGFWGYNAGPYSEVPYQGHNRARLGKTITHCVEYLGPWLNMGSITSYFDFLRSRNVPALLSVIGYPNYYRDSESQYKNNVWYTALYGGKGVIYYSAIHPPNWAKNDGTGAPLRVTELIKEANSDLVGGMGRMLIESERSNTGIGIYYSRSSEYTLSWLNRVLLSEEEGSKTKGEEKKTAEAMRDDPGGGEIIAAVNPKVRSDRLRHLFAHSLGTMRELVLSSGYNYNLVFEDHLVSGELKKNYKVILLPSAVSLSNAEIEALKEFVTKGGLLVADLQTGIYDELGSVRKMKSDIETLFGIKRDTAIFAIEEVEGMLDKNSPVEGYGTGDVKTAGGQPCLSIEGHDALIINHYGKGRTLYLNMLPKRHGNWDNVARDPLLVSPALRHLFIHMAESVGAERPIVLFHKDGEKELHGLEHIDIVRFNHGKNYYIFLHSKHNAGAPIEIMAKLDRPLHVYDMRKRRYLGYTDRPLLNTSEPGDASAYSFLQYRVTGIKVTLPKNIKAGMRVPINVKLGTSGEKPQNHIVRLEFYEPGGSLNRKLTRSIDLPGGETDTFLHLTLDETSGEWRLEVRDVQTGVSTKTAFKLQTVKN